MSDASNAQNPIRNGNRNASGNAMPGAGAHDEAQGNGNGKTSGVEPVLMLKSCAIFMHLDVEALVPLAQSARTLALAAAERIEIAATDERRAYFVHEGAIAAHGVGCEARAVGSGEVCGFISCLAGAPGEFAVEALSDAVVLEVLRSHLITALDESFAIQTAVVTQLGRRALELRNVLPPLPRSARPAPTDDSPPSLGAQIRLLSETQALGGLRVHTLGELALGATLERFAAGDTLWERGDAADSCVLVLAGEIERSGETGRRVVEPGSLAGLSESLARRERPDRARAQSDALVLRLRAEQFHDTIEDDPEASQDLISVLARGVLTAQQYRDAQQAPAESTRT